MANISQKIKSLKEALNSVSEKAEEIMLNDEIQKLKAEFETTGKNDGELKHQYLTSNQPVIDEDTTRDVGRIGDDFYFAHPIYSFENDNKELTGFNLRKDTKYYDDMGSSTGRGNEVNIENLNLEEFIAKSNKIHNKDERIGSVLANAGHNEKVAKTKKTLKNEILREEIKNFFGHKK